MRDQTARDLKFPAACARCGGRISEPVTFCPHCGAHARFALAGDALHAAETAPAGPAARKPQEPRGGAASARAEPKVPHYDFEGDLDPPWPGPPTPLFASPDGDPYGEVHAPGLRGERQWGLKGGTALVIAAFVVLYGGAVAVHRYDGASPLSQPSASKSADGAIVSSGGSASNFSAPPGNNASSNGGGSGSDAQQPPAPVADNAAPSNGSAATNALSTGSPSTASTSSPATPSTGSPSTSAAANVVAPNGVAASSTVKSAANNSAMPAPNADASRPPDTTVASLPPPSAPTQAAPSAAPAQTPAEAQPNGTQESRAAGRVRGHTRSAEARGGNGGTAVAGNQADLSGRQSYRSQSQREAAPSGRAAAARALDSAQAQLAKSDLRGARTSLARALAADPNNGEALSLREQLLSREQERDASLSAAHACVVQSRWNCVWHNAGKALSADASSTEAKALVDRAIVESGAATAPAGPGPDNVQVPMLQ